MCIRDSLQTHGLMGNFMDLSEYYFKTGIELLEKRWTKCIEVGGDYIEK